MPGGFWRNLEIFPDVFEKVNVLTSFSLAFIRGMYLCESGTALSFGTTEHCDNVLSIPLGP